MFRFDVVDVDMIQKQGVQPEISLKILSFIFSHMVSIIHMSSKNVMKIKIYVLSSYEIKPVCLPFKIQ
jgi:hypothetical protein